MPRHCNWSQKPITGGGGGCEDPRIHLYVMTYTAFSAKGPRIALAVSEDLFHWRRLGLASFRPYHGIGFEGVDSKEKAFARYLLSLGEPGADTGPTAGAPRDRRQRGARPERCAGAIERRIHDFLGKPPHRWRMEMHLWTEWPQMLADLPALGITLAVSRNASAVLGRKGVYPDLEFSCDGLHPRRLAA